MSKPKVPSPRPQGPKQRDLPAKPTESEIIFRWGLLVIGASFLLLSFAIKLSPALFPSGSIGVAELIAKVGLVLSAGWFAWPTIVRLKRSPGGLIVLTFGIAMVVLFILRPRTIWITGPFFTIAVVLALVVGWLQRFR